MQHIHRVRTANEDGTHYNDGLFFMTKADAIAATLNSDGEKDNWKQYSVISVYESEEYDPNIFKRHTALAKLTEEEKVLLGLV